jgi:3-methyl-2-oxobutanoate hydroxymethyltransferase
VAKVDRPCRKEFFMSIISTPKGGNGAAASVTDTRRVTVPDFLAAKGRDTRLTVLTAYDYCLARLLDTAGVDALLVGDSLGMVVQGHDHCLSVTLEDVIYHTRCVARGCRRALLISDMPFMSYQVNAEEALRNAGRLIQEAGAHAVKLEGGVRSADRIAAIVEADIPVMGHIGLTPQSVRRLGGFRVQREEDRLWEDAMAIEKAGAFAIVIECVPAPLAQKITEAVKIPTIGIGAGAECDGQVLVTQDMLGMFDDFQPRFVKHFASLGREIGQAVEAYCREVREGTFPAEEHSFR